MESISSPLLGLFLGVPIVVFTVLYIFSPKRLANIFNSIAKVETFPAKRINKYILYGLLWVVCYFIAIGICVGFCHLIKQIDFETGTALLSDERTIIVSAVMGFVLYFWGFYYIRKRKGLSLRVSMCEAVYSFMLIITLVISGIVLFYVGVIALCIGLALLILGLCLGGVGDRVKVTDGNLLPTSKTLTRGLDGNWRDYQGRTYEKTGRNEWTEK